MNHWITSDPLAAASRTPTRVNAYEPPTAAACARMPQARGRMPTLAGGGLLSKRATCSGWWRSSTGTVGSARWRTPQIADRLDAFASMLELAEANPYTPRAYRRAAETIRAAGVPVAELVRSGRVRQLRGIGPGIEARLRELVETGSIAELAELERELAPDMIGLGHYLGLSAKRSLELARALGYPDRRRAPRGGRRRPAGERSRHRAEDRGAAARGARQRAPRRARDAGCCSTVPGSSSQAWRLRSTASRPAIRGGGATHASSWQLSAPRAIRSRCSTGSPPSLRWSRSSSGRSGAPSG